MKKLVLLGLVGTLSATTTMADKGFHSGTYLGANVGYTHMKAKMDRSLFADAVFDSSKSASPTHNSLIGEIFGGYRHFLRNGFFVGGELGLSFDTAEASQDFVHESLPTAPALLQGKFQATTKVTRKYAVIPSLIVGKTFSDKWLGFLKVGPSISKFNLKNSQELLNAAGASVGKGGFSANKTKVGVKVSGGAEYAFSDKLSTRLTVSYERFSKISKSSDFAGDDDFTDSVSVKPSFVNVTVGVMYKF